MKLQTKVAGILGATWVVLCLIILLDAIFFIARDYRRLESNLMQHEVEDTKHALDRLINNLAVYSLAWSQWDDAYAFMAKQDKKFIESNFIGATYSTANINFLMFFNSNGAFYYGKYYDSHSKKISDIPSETLRYFAMHKDFIQHTSVDSRKIGVLPIDNRLIVMSSLPVIASQGKGPIRGSILMGYYLTDQFFKELQETIGMDVLFYPLNDTLQNPALYKIYQALYQEKNNFFISNDRELSLGFLPFYSVDKKPLGLLRVAIPRFVYSEGVSVIYHYVAMVVLIGIIVLVVMLFFLKQSVLNRIVQINNQVHRIGQDKNFSSSMKVSGHDELTEMVDVMNNLIHDIDRSHKQLEFLALHDPLTKFPNRKYGYDLLNLALIEASQNDSIFAILFIDIDKFKQVNDQYGHDVGDQLIVRIANIIHDNLQKQDILIRQSGDEFIVGLKAIKKIDDVTSTAKRLLAAITKKMLIGNRHLSISVSIGISLYPIDGTTTDILLRHADQSMYIAKKNAGNTFHYYNQKRSLTQSSDSE